MEDSYAPLATTTVDPQAAAASSKANDGRNRRFESTPKAYRQLPAEDGIGCVSREPGGPMVMSRRG